MRSLSSLCDNRHFSVTTALNFDMVDALVVYLLFLFLFLFLLLLFSFDFFLFFKTGSHCIALAALNLTLSNRLASHCPPLLGLRVCATTAWLSAYLSYTHLFKISK